MAILIIILLIILNGYFSLAEVALISVNNAELAEEEGRNNRKAFQVLQLIRDPEEFLSAVQVGITLLGLLEGIYGGDMVARQLEGWFAQMGMSNFVAHVAALVTGIGAITYLTIVFGELVPKSIALQMPLRVSLSIAPSLVLFSKLLYPFIKLLMVSTRLILNSFSIKTADNNKISEKDLKSMLGTAFKQGVLGKQELWMHENVFTFDDLKAKSIMKPARITICLSYDWTRVEVMEAIKKRPYSYFPVYQHGKGDVKGVIRTKDFFLNEAEDWHQDIRPNCSIHPNTTVKDIFNSFKEKKLDFGVVTSESGQYLGIIAMQDIMEGVFGDLPELEDYKAYFYQQGDKQWIAEDFIHLQRIRNELSLPWLRDYEDRYLTLSELFAGEIGRVNDQGILVLNGVTFQVVTGTRTDPRTIKIMLP